MAEKKRVLVKSIAIAYICLYAIVYPLATHFLMNGERGGYGSAPIQAFQMLTLVALLFVGKVGRVSLKNLFDLWTVGAFYFTALTDCFVVSYSQEDKITEIAYCARYVSWFLFATILSRSAFQVEKLRVIAYSFWIGATIQATIATRAFLTQNVASIYKEVYATTGSADVSGKTIVAFVTLAAFFALYMIIKGRKGRAIYVLGFALAATTLVVSFNRATQLSVAIVACWTLAYLFRTRRIKSAILFIVCLVAIGAALGFSFGDTFFMRWQNIAADGGSGRDKLIVASVRNFFNPDSLTTLFFGKGFCHTKELMHEACGLWIGTHSDLFDFLTSYGLIGAIFYFLVVSKLFALAKNVELRSAEFFFIRISTLFIVFAGLFTGQFQGTYVYFMFFTICHYWRAVAATRWKTDRVGARFAREEGWNDSYALPNGAPIPSPRPPFDRYDPFEPEFEDDSAEASLALESRTNDEAQTRVHNLDAEMKMIEREEERCAEAERERRLVEEKRRYAPAYDFVWNLTSEEDARELTNETEEYVWVLNGDDVAKK